MVYNFSWFLYSFSESKSYKLHELKYWKKRITQIEQKIEFANNDIDKRYLIEGPLENAYIKYDRNYPFTHLK